MTAPFAFLFPGQGSQRVGMGRALKEARPELFERYIVTAADISGLPLAQLSLDGTLEQLTATEVAQPALFALSTALHHVAREAGLEPAAAAGHSLGEYSAACATGAIEFATCLRVVCERGRLMARAQDEHPGSMAAISGLPSDRVAELCAHAAHDGVVVPANFNAPTQVVVSGETRAVDRVVELATAEGAESATRLRVGAAFHSPLMEPIEREFGKILRAIEVRDPRVPVVVNVWARAVSSGEELRDALTAQISRPVRWQECVRTLVEMRLAHFLELGSGRVLAGLTRLNDPDVTARAADRPAQIESFAAVLS